MNMAPSYGTRSDRTVLKRQHLKRVYCDEGRNRREWRGLRNKLVMMASLCQGQATCLAITSLSLQHDGTRIDAQEEERTIAYHCRRGSCTGIVTAYEPTDSNLGDLISKALPAESAGSLD
jgi:hypothetical protein